MSFNDYFNNTNILNVNQERNEEITNNVGRCIGISCICGVTVSIFIYLWVLGHS